jgi:hypothetical protein
LGGLHNLRQADFENYHEYAEAKKEFEIGQFFTPHAVCKLKTHPHLKKHYKKAVALVSKFRNQTLPENCTNTKYEEWERNRLTYAKVLSILYRYIRTQNEKPRKEVALVRTSYGFKLKGYAPHPCARYCR